ncbi:protein lethal(2)essential for life-like [Neocloeon triangulifer]|uniref:protein lethal(2)essential for life-like n=1 Tax=Neocloeon triangulifer TaxID=2078957 RepID=UPI00286EC614|nr:protein lethal(2)essential for life-like [Neocloeon triangulifer]
MSLVPLIFDDIIRPISLFDQNFGLGLLNDDLPPMLPYGAYMRPWRHLARSQSGVSSVSNDSSKFQVNLDVQQFKPEEISVKIVDNAVVIEGKHEEKQDQHGFISRQFVRKYVLPEGVDKEKVECKLSSDGVLIISAPKLALPDAKEQSIHIMQTNQPAVQSKQSEDKKASHL